MERQDHLMLVTDAGVELHLGWDHDIPYTCLLYTSDAADE